MTALIRLEQLCKTFHKGSQTIQVLKDLDLEIHAGETVSITGRSGVGKSTLLQVMGTLDRPDSGHVYYDDEDVFAYKERALAVFRNRSIGFVFQFHHLLPDFTAVENVALPARIAKADIPKAEARALELLHLVGLSERIRHLPGELSGGEQQRVAIARALMMEPKVLLADELTGNLDAATSEGIHELLLDLNGKLGATLVVVTHNQDLASRMKRRLVLVEGRIVAKAEGDA